MPFVKLDCDIIRSTIWQDRPAREVFVTALLLAEPVVTDEHMPEIATREIRETGFIVPPGRYGFVRAAGPGIVNTAGLPREEGLDALERLAAPDPQSRTKDFDGRRLVRVDGGFIVLTYAKHRDRDATAAERQRRWRERREAEKAAKVTPSRPGITPSRDVSVTDVEGDVEAEVDADPDMIVPAAGNGVLEVQDGRSSAKKRSGAYSQEFETFWKHTGSCRGNKAPAWKEFQKAKVPLGELIRSWDAYMLSKDPSKGFVQHLERWLRGRGWETTWLPAAAENSKAAKTSIVLDKILGRREGASHGQ